MPRMNAQQSNQFWANRLINEDFFRQPSPQRFFGQSSSGVQEPTGGINNFRFPWETNQLGPEFRTDITFPRRLRPASFNELRERQGQNLFQNFGAIASGTEGSRRRRDPITGQPLEGTALGGRSIYEQIPDFNVQATDVDIGGALSANNQRFSALRQAGARGAIGTFGGRLGPRSGGAGLAATNQFAAPLFAAQAGANANLQAGAAFQNQASKQTADLRNLQTRIFGVSGQERMLGLFQREAGQRANIGIGRGGLELGRERVKLDKEGQDLRAALEKKRFGLEKYTTGQRLALDRYNAYLRKIELEFRMRQASGGFSFGDFAGIAGGILGGPLGGVLGKALGGGAERVWD